MNAKKIMGAVLVALLAAALFVGVGAAEETGQGTIFLYQKGLDAYDSTYTCGDSTVVINGGVASTTDLSKFVNGGKYSNGTKYFIVKLPNAGFTAVGDTGTDKYDAMAEGLVSGQAVTFQAVADATIGNFGYEKIVIYNPKGEPTVFTTGVSGGQLVLDAAKSANTFKVKGTYKIQAFFNKGSSDLAPITPNGALAGQMYEFTVFSAEGELEASADTVISGNAITVTVTGAPGATFTIEADGFGFSASNQPSGISTLTNFQLPNDGKITVYLKAGDDTGKQTILLKGNGETVDSVAVTIVKGTITATADEDFYFIGNPILLSGTTTAGTPLYFWIEGTNFMFSKINFNQNDAEYNVDGTWTAEIASAGITQTLGNGDVKELTTGTYTIFVTTNSSNTLTKKLLMDEAYATVGVSMKMPFLTDIEAASTAIQGSEYKVTGTAYAAEEVRLYVFGTSYFTAYQDKSIDEGAFEFKFDVIDQTDDEGYMAPGTYFYLIQHPMNDRNFNVWNGTGFGDWIAGATPMAEGNFYYAATNATGGQTLYDDGLVFNVWKRGTNYAAQALLDEISGQNIDDIFVQGTFKVEAQKLVINPIPAEVAKGNKLAVSGYTNSGEGVEVIVNVLAGTFGATVKGDENAAIFLTEKAITNEDGTFEAAIDTSKLPIGNYIVTVEIDATPYDSAAVEIVAAADKPDTPDTPDVPDTPDTPDTPTEPETPGFGALAALAGLGAVAVLLLRRE